MARSSWTLCSCSHDLVSGFIAPRVTNASHRTLRSQAQSFIASATSPGIPSAPSLSSPLPFTLSPRTTSLPSLAKFSSPMVNQTRFSVCGAQMTDFRVVSPNVSWKLKDPCRIPFSMRSPLKQWTADTFSGRIRAKDSRRALPAGDDAGVTMTGRFFRISPTSPSAGTKLDRSHSAVRCSRVVSPKDVCSRSMSDSPEATHPKATNQGSPEKSTDKDDLVQRVQDLLSAHAKPVVEADGGYIEFHRITEEGVVEISLLGACATCPSSSVTLNFMIKNMLMHYVPEVTGVVNIAKVEEHEDCD